MVTWMIDKYGNDDLRAKFVPQLAVMDKLGSYCLTEPGKWQIIRALEDIFSP